MLDGIKELIKISGTKHEDLPLLVGEIKTEEGIKTLKKAIDKKPYRKIMGVNDLRFHLDTETYEEKIQSYNITERPYNDGFDIVIQPPKSVKHIHMTLKVNSSGEVSELV